MKKKFNKTDTLPKPLLIFNTIFIAFIILVMSIPILNVLAISFSSKIASETPGLLLIPKDFTLDGYKDVWTSYNLWRPLLNTVYVSIAGTFFHIILSALAGYAMLDKNIPFRKIMTTFVVLTMTIPGELTLVSMYAVNKEFGLLNSYTGLIVNGVASGFSILLMRNYFSSIPKELMEAAKIDGASELKIFSSIYMRLSAPAIITIGTLQFIGRWNNIHTVVTLISDSNKTTLPVVLKWLVFDQTSTSSATYIYLNTKMAGIVIAAVPLIIIYFAVQRFFTEGGLSGSVKQ